MSTFRANYNGTHLPRTPQIMNIVVCRGKNRLFSLPLCRMIFVHWQDMRSLFAIVYLYQTAYCTCCIGPDLYPVVYFLKLFKIVTIQENTVFYPQAGCGGRKDSHATSWRLDSGESPLALTLLRGRGVGGSYWDDLRNFAGFVVVFYFS